MSPVRPGARTRIGLALALVVLSGVNAAQQQPRAADFGTKATAAVGKNQFAEALSFAEEALKLDPNNETALIEKGRALRGLERVDEALAHLERSVIQLPKSSRLHNTFGVTLERAKQLTRAIEEYAEAVRLAPKDVVAQGNLGNAYRLKGDFTRAETELRRAIALNPQYVNAHTNLGTTLLRLNRTAEARAEYEEVLRLEPGNKVAQSALGNAQGVRRSEPEATTAGGAGAPATRGGLASEANLGSGAAASFSATFPRTDPVQSTQGTLGAPSSPPAANLYEEVVQLFEQGDEVKAARMLKQQAEQTPHDPQLQNNYGALLLGYGKYTEAEPFLRRALEQRIGYAAAWNNLGLCLVGLKRGPEACAAFKTAAAIDAECDEAWLNLAAVALTAGQSAAALTNLKSAVKANPESAPVRVGMALFCLRSGNKELALGLLDEALRLHPECVTALVERGWLHLGDARLDAAQLDFTRAISVRPQHARAHRGLGLVLFHQGQVQLSVKAFRCAIRFGLDDSATHTDLGNAFQAYGLEDANMYARREFLRALELDPKNLIATYNLACVLERLGDRDAAATRYGALLALQPKHFQGLINLAVIENQRKNFTASMKLLDRAEALMPGTTLISLNRSIALHGVGRTQEAGALLQRVMARETDPQLREAARGLLESWGGR